MKTYKVKLKLIETHYLDIDAFDIEDAKQQAQDHRCGLRIAAENDREIEPHKINVEIVEIGEVNDE
jgi:hypothetical protein